MIKQLSRYSLVGVANTAVHWIVFALLFMLGLNQATSNGLAFLVAASLSYVLNAHYTFDKKPHKKGYAFFVLSMGLVSIWVGWLGDVFAWPAILTLVLFSLISLVLGFAWSKWVIFKHYH